MDSNWIKGRKIAEEMTEVMRDNEMEKSLDDFPQLKETLQSNPYSRELVEKVCAEHFLEESLGEFKSGSERSSETFRTKLDFAIRRKVRRVVFIRSAVSIAAALAVLSLLVYVVADGVYSPEREVAQTTQPEGDIIRVPTLVVDGSHRVSLVGGQVEDILLHSKQIENVGEKRISYAVHSDEAEDLVMDSNTIIVPAKFNYTIVLADSTEVILNAQSELRYPTKFCGDERKVFLKGEAYFNVKKDSKPFIVSTEQVDIKVYGTRFNVNLHEKGVVKTVLVSGSVGVSVHGDTLSEVMMKPNQLFSFNIRTGEKELRNVDTTIYVAWLSGDFRCEQEKLSILLDQLSMWYGIEFIYNNNAIKETEVSINISNGTSIENILKVLEEMLQVQFIREGGSKYSVN